MRVGLCVSSGVDEFCDVFANPGLLAGAVDIASQQRACVYRQQARLGLAIVRVADLRRRRIAARQVRDACSGIVHTSTVCEVLVGGTEGTASQPVGSGSANAGLIQFWLIMWAEHGIAFVIY